MLSNVGSFVIGFGCGVLFVVFFYIVDLIARKNKRKNK